MRVQSTVAEVRKRGERGSSSEARDQTVALIVPIRVHLLDGKIRPREAIDQQYPLSSAGDTDRQRKCA